MSLTFAMIKPDVVSASKSGMVISKLQSAGFRIVSMKQINMSKAIAEGFYAEHQGKPFFDNLVNFMISDSTIVMVLEKDNAVSSWREFIGATDPAKATAGTIRSEFGDKANITRNAVHGSDSDISAAREIGYFFSGQELIR